MKYAVIQTGGKQYKVAEGETVTVEKLATEPGNQFVFDQVLLLVNGSTHVGQPYVAGATVSAKVLDHVKGEKIRVAKFKAKARYRRVTGHRQQLTKLLIEKIEAKSDSKAKKATSSETEEK
jgi:large subunit ribosomal protein L21